MKIGLQPTNNQRGSMVLELVLVAAVVALLGFVGVRYYQANHTATTPSHVASTKDTKSVQADGKVETAVNAVTEDADVDKATSAASEEDATDVTASSNEAAQVEGSVNSDSF